MKQRLTKKDLTQLTDMQKQRLNELWIPGVYDVAVASICMDIANEKYDEIEFVVGGISLLGTHVYLADIRAATGAAGDTEEDADIRSPYEDYSTDEEDEESYEEFDESDLECNYERPATFNKEACLPLLNIGQMIDLLQRNNFGKHDFYLTASTYEVGCELGRENTIYGATRDYQEAELCDVLWASVRAILG